MKPDPPPSDVWLSQDVADLPPKRKWFGYTAVAASLAFTYLESVVEQAYLDCLFLVCGPPPLMAAMRTLLAVAGVSARQVIMEDFEIR